MGNSKVKKYFTIPNLMGYFRILLVPVFLWLFVKSEHTPGYNVYYWLMLVTIGVSGLTDFFDGRVARKFNQVTDWGKMLDPIADKITIGAIIVALAIKYPIVLAMVALYIVKEGYMSIVGMILLKKGQKIEGAMWYGKVCTFATYVIIIALLVFKEMPQMWVDILVFVNMAIMLFTFIMYIPYHVKKFKEAKSE